jgi:iron complex transport system ATP-binding protein
VEPEIVVAVNDIRYVRSGRAPILDGVSWEIRAGDRWILFGPNGSGKTSLLKIITGYEFATSGSVSLLGERIGGTYIPDLQKRIGWVSDALNPLIHGEDPVFEIVLAGAFAGTRLWYDTTPEQDARARLLLTQVGCLHLLSTPYETLSQGERKKIMIARALMNDPALIILDEPCEGLDLAAREQFLQVLTNLTQTHPAVAMVLVTHHVEEIIPAFTRMMIIRYGKMFARGQIRELLNSKNLSELFGMAIEIVPVGSRFFSRLPS